ncbi:MAG: DedA family protein [Candidatus Methylomirabilota bacterium]
MDAITTWFGHAVQWITETIFALGYPGIVALMALESSFFPFPSEVVLPPAGYLAAQGRMNAWIALGAGILGSLIGAVFNYVLAVRLGRPLLHRYGKYLLIKETALDRAEEYFRSHGEISTFVGRLIPVIRQYISLPAGLARMRLDLFAFYTALGAGIWCAILTWIGWYLGTQAERLGGLPPEQVHRYVNTALLILAPAVALLVVIYVIRHRRRRRAAG